MLKISKYFIAALTAPLLLAGTAAHSAGTAPEKTLNARLAAATSAKYPNADTVSIYEREHVTYQPDGLSETTLEFCIKALNENGRKNLRRMNFNFDSAYGGYTVISAALIKPDGRRIAVDLDKNVSVAISTQSMGSEIFEPTSKVLSLVVPDLEIGDAVEAKLKYKSVKTPFPGIFSDSFLLQGDDPLLFAEVVVDSPAALPLRSIAVKSPVGGTVKYHGARASGDRIVHRWTAANVPQVITEPNMPPMRGVAQRLLVSTAGSWEELSRWYWNLCRPRLDAADDELKKEVAKLVAGKKNDAEKVMALFQFVSQNIRYTGVNAEDRAPGFEPHDVKDTFRQRHGVCRDKAGLLTAMLEIAGIKAYPVLFRADSIPVDAEVPASRFNHAVVAWERSPGNYQLMDPTCETTQDLFPAYLANQSYLVAKPEGDTLRRSPSPPPEHNALAIVTDAEFRQDGTLTGRSTLDFKGCNDIMYRSAFSRHGINYVRQMFVKYLLQALPGAKLTKFEVTPKDVRDMSAPLRVVMEFTASDLQIASGTSTLPMPELSRYFGAAKMLADDLALDTRRHPQMFDFTAVTTEKIRVGIPKSANIQSLPAPVDRKAPGMVWKRNFAFRDGAIVSESLLAMDRLEVSPQEYPALRRVRRAQSADLIALPLLQIRYSSIPKHLLGKLFPDADSFLELDRTELEVRPDDSIRIVQTRRRRILNYAGVKKHSTLKLGYTPRYQTLEIGATVTSPDGKTLNLDPKHVIEMDADWVAAAPRYPKAATKVAVLPGVAVGALVETRIVLTERETGFIHFQTTFSDYAPTAVSELSLTCPRRLKLRYSPPPVDAEVHTSTRGGSHIGSWRMVDLPAIPREPQQPEPAMFAPTVTISNGSYADYGGALDRKLRELAAAPSPAVNRMFADIPTKGMTKLQTAVAVRDAVARRLRPAGPPLSSVRPADLTAPERTLADGYGNSPDRAAVIAALLEKAGIEYSFVAASDQPYILENIKPLRNHPRRIFGEMLVYIPELNLYLNDTDQYAVPGSTRHAARIGLDLKSGRVLAIRPHYKAYDETITDCSITIAADGSAKIAAVRELRGNYHNTQKRIITEMTPEKRRQYLETLAAGMMPAAKLESAKYDFSKYPGKIELVCRVDNFALPVGTELLFELPGYGAMARSIGVGDSERKTPMLRGKNFRCILKYRIELPPGYAVDRSRESRIDIGKRNSGYFTEHFSVVRNRIIIDSRLMLPAELIQPWDYVELADLQRDLIRHTGRRIVLTRVTAAPRKKE